MKFSVRAAALTGGVLWAAAMFGVILANLFRPSYGTDFIAMMASIYPGWHFMHRWTDLLIGSVYGFIDGAVCGLVFAWIYDLFVNGPHSPSRPA